MHFQLVCGQKTILGRTGALSDSFDSGNARLVMEKRGVSLSSEEMTMKDKVR
jgi:hypothetical protein